MTNHQRYILQLADNALILGQRLSEWCGHGPVLEQDIALTNIALDQIGLSRYLFAYASALEENKRSEDDIAFTRDEWNYYNVLLAEQPNINFAHTICRQFMMDTFHVHLFSALQTSSDQRLADIAGKTIKEVKYHRKFSADWMLRLGDGTKLSHVKMQKALNDLWPFVHELITPSEVDEEMYGIHIAPDLRSIQGPFYADLRQIIAEATLKLPESVHSQTGGKSGIHSEHLGHLLAEMQFMQRAYPNLNW